MSALPTCINNPGGEFLLVLRKWQIEFCEGNKCAAALLSFLIYFHDVKVENSRKNKRANDVAEMHGDKRIQDETLHQFHTTEEIREDYIRKSSPIAAFIMDCLETDSDAFIEKKVLYNEFAEYCRGRSLPTVVQDTFFKNLPQHAVVSDFRPRIEGKGRFTSFKGLRYKADGWSNRSNRSTNSSNFFPCVSRRISFSSILSILPNLSSRNTSRFSRFSISVLLAISEVFERKTINKKI